MSRDDGLAGGIEPMPRRLLEAAAKAAARPSPPLPTPRTGAALVVVAGLGVLFGFTLLRGLRGNAASLGLGLVLVPAALNVLAGAVLVALALKEGVPGRAVSTSIRAGAFASAFVLLALLAYGLDRATGSLGGGFGPMACYRVGLVIAVPAAGLFGWLLARAYPLRPVSAFSLGALGAGLLADATLHLTCPATSLEHTLGIHGGAVATLGLLGAIAGLFRSIRRRRRVR
jgi:hypothetical protein